MSLTRERVDANVGNTHELQWREITAAEAHGSSIIIWVSTLLICAQNYLTFAFQLGHHRKKAGGFPWCIKNLQRGSCSSKIMIRRNLQELKVKGLMPRPPAKYFLPPTGIANDFIWFQRALYWQDTNERGDTFGSPSGISTLEHMIVAETPKPRKSLSSTMKSPLSMVGPFAAAYRREQKTPKQMSSMVRSPLKPVSANVARVWGSNIIRLHFYLRVVVGLQIASMGSNAIVFESLRISKSMP